MKTEERRRCADFLRRVADDIEADESIERVEVRLGREPIETWPVDGWATHEPGPVTMLTLKVVRT